MESRRLLATYTVDSLADNMLDDGLTTLREALELANANSNADTIDFAASLFSGGPQTLLVTEGQLHIDEETTIDGPGAALLTIDASGNDPTPGVADGQGTSVFYVRDSGFFDRRVTLRNLTLTGGDTSLRGGAVWAEDPLTIEDSTLTNNHATNNGGGIYAEKRLEFHRSTLSENSGFSGGGVYSLSTILMTGSTVTENRSRIEGGGISIRSAMLTINDSEISHNETQSASLEGGGGIYASATTGLLQNTEVISNTSNLNGGGYAQREGRLTVNGGSFDGNEATNGSGGAIYAVFANNTTLNGATLANNSASVSGGGLFADFSTTVSVNNSTLDDNDAQSLGGGLYVRNTFSVGVVHSHITNNSAGSGGGGITIDRDSGVFIGDSTFDANSTDGSGGGLLLDDATSSINTSTFVGNSAAVGGAVAVRTTDRTSLRSTTLSGNRASDSGGAIYSMGADVSLRHSTMTANQADSDDNGTGAGGGIYVTSGTDVSLSHTIAAGNSDAGDAPDVWVLPSGTSFPSFVTQYSLLGSNAGNGRPETLPGTPDSLGNLVGGPTNGLVDAMLLGLADNGGPTLTHVPMQGSPALDAGNPTLQAGVTSTPAYDQRGDNFGRVQNDRLDIGAIEVQDPHSADFDEDGIVSGSDFLAWQRGFGTDVPDATRTDGDADNDRDTDANDLQIWMQQYSTAPSAALAAIYHPLSLPEQPSRESEVDAAIAAIAEEGVDSSVEVKAPSLIGTIELTAPSLHSTPEDSGDREVSSWDIASDDAFADWFE